MSAADRAIRISTAAAVLGVSGVAAYVSYWHVFVIRARPPRRSLQLTVQLRARASVQDGPIRYSGRREIQDPTPGGHDATRPPQQPLYRIAIDDLEQPEHLLGVDQLIRARSVDIPVRNSITVLSLDPPR